MAKKLSGTEYISAQIMAGLIADDMLVAYWQECGGASVDHHVNNARARLRDLADRMGFDLVERASG